jgi:hypothetical protein
MRRVGLFLPGQKRQVHEDGETGRGRQEGRGRGLRVGYVARLRRAGLDPHRLHVPRAPVQNTVDAPCGSVGPRHDLARPQYRIDGGSEKLRLSRATRASASRRSAMPSASDGISASGNPISVTASAASPGKTADATRSS